MELAAWLAAQLSVAGEFTRVIDSGSDFDSAGSGSSTDIVVEAEPTVTDLIINLAKMHF